MDGWVGAGWVASKRCILTRQDGVLRLYTWHVLGMSEGCAKEVASGDCILYIYLIEFEIVLLMCLSILLVFMSSCCMLWVVYCVVVRLLQGKSDF